MEGEIRWARGSGRGLAGKNVRVLLRKSIQFPNRRIDLHVIFVSVRAAASERERPRSANSAESVAISDAPFPCTQLLLKNVALCAFGAPISYL